MEEHLVLQQPLHPQPSALSRELPPSASGSRRALAAQGRWEEAASCRDLEKETRSPRRFSSHLLGAVPRTIQVRRYGEAKGWENPLGSCRGSFFCVCDGGVPAGPCLAACRGGWCPRCGNRGSTGAAGQGPLQQERGHLCLPVMASESHQLSGGRAARFLLQGGGCCVSLRLLSVLCHFFW